MIISTCETRSKLEAFAKLVSIQKSNDKIPVANKVKSTAVIRGQLCMSFDTAFILVKDLAQSREDGKQVEEEKSNNHFVFPCLLSKTTNRESSTALLSC